MAFNNSVAAGKLMAGAIFAAGYTTHQNKKITQNANVCQDTSSSLYNCAMNPGGEPGLTV